MRCISFAAPLTVLLVGECATSSMSGWTPGESDKSDNELIVSVDEKDSVADIAPTTGGNKLTALAKSEDSNLRGEDAFKVVLGTPVKRNTVGRFPLGTSSPGSKGMVGIFYLLMHAKPVVDLVIGDTPAGSNAAGMDHRNELREEGVETLKAAFGLMWNKIDANGSREIYPPTTVDLDNVMYNMAIKLFSTRSRQKHSFDLADYVNWVITGSQMGENPVVKYARFTTHIKNVVGATNAPVILFEGSPYFWKSTMGDQLPPPFEVVPGTSNRYILVGMMITKYSSDGWMLTSYGTNGPEQDIYYMEYPYDKGAGLFHVTDNGELFLEAGEDASIENKFRPVIDTLGGNNVEYTLMYVRSDGESSSSG